MYIVMVLVFLVGVGLGVGFPIIYYSDTIRKRDQEITSLKVGKTELLGRIAAHDRDAQASYDRAAEWRIEAVRAGRRIKELTDRLLLAGKIPELDDGSEPMSVAEADQLATERERQERELAHARNVMKGREFAGMEPVAVNDEEVPPVARLDDSEASDEEEDTSFASRIGHDG